MPTEIPSTEQVRALLLKFRQVQLKSIEGQSGVPFSTLVKIRQGTTKNPGIETVRAIFRTDLVKQQLQSVNAVAATAATAQIGPSEALGV
ncbi:hypothetical protein [Comamonas terrigena]|uniref:XRE family transcriptional regulator n=1 Tax=Comamonas terrigena TaxID=32013 RepID=A0A2A7UXV4_COMTR|nr:hypothetical protein [Comamonas terrigena]MDH1499324.1 hypothetical protein [Comamonas terrigena]PEH90084.1 hypothetical protein CRM82_17120 [Comamonas terrigena]BBL25376.1 hypothetical protein CT3_28310 [Comamonas terrigena NBRC 13299]SUY71048.1 Predicted transcriptional regulator with an HTH domain [Comamonas terrigena]